MDNNSISKELTGNIKIDRLLIDGKYLVFNLDTYDVWKSSGIDIHELKYICSKFVEYIEFCEEQDNNE